MILDSLNNLLKQSSNKIERWFDQQYQNLLPCIYSSVDIRYSGFKIAPVDTNLFPAGFNNLDQPALLQASHNLKLYLTKYFPTVKKILLIAESHTRNKYYLDNLISLDYLIKEAGFENYIAIFNEIVISSSDNSLQTQNGFIPDIILLNNDLTTGIPSIMNNIRQPIIPNAALGWHKRRKSNYFTNYNKIVRNFSLEFNIDPFLISTLHSNCIGVNFEEKIGLEGIAFNIEKMINILRRKYKTYGFTDDPYIFVKSDKGTYGMGVIAVKSGKEILHINKKNKNKMNIIKEGVLNNEIILQEGIRTIDRYRNNPAEKMIYLMGTGKPIAVIDRFNNKHSEFDNLNSNGMGFNLNKNNSANKSFELIAMLAALAAATE